MRLRVWTELQSLRLRTGELRNLPRIIPCPRWNTAGTEAILQTIDAFRWFQFPEAFQ